MDIEIKELLKEFKPLIDETIKKYIPKEFDEKHLNFMLGSPRFKYTPETITEGISKPVWDYLERGGKRWRPYLFLLVYEALGGNPKDVIDFAILPELIHNATIIHDDIEDMSEERRGKPALHLIFGEDIAINVGDALYFIPFLPFFKLKHRFDKERLIKAYEICIQELIRVAMGQATDIVWHKGLCNADDVTEEEYLQMCLNKTGCIPRMSARLAATLAGKSEEVVEKLGRLAEGIGVAFQIQDDILNLTGEEFAKRKGGLGEDITEGKRSLLVIHTLRKANEKDRKRLLEILNMHTTDQDLRNEAIEIIKKYGSVEYAKEKARSLVKEAWDEIEKMLPESEAKKKLKAFAYYLIERKI
jgi:geranylgeranyl pyrophosphate synthase